MFGIVDRRRGDVRELEIFHRLDRVAGDRPVFVRGALAACAGDSRAFGWHDGDGFACAFSGILYGASHARGPATSPDEDARRASLSFRAGAVARLADLRGRFSAAMWDEHERRGVLCCDLMTVQDLFVWAGPEALVFATDLPDLLALCLQRPEVDAGALSGWLADGLLLDGRTFYAGVRRLQPGECFSIGDTSSDAETYWEPRYRGLSEATQEEQTARLADGLTEAVSKRLAPRSTAVILSGGVDSSTVTAVAARANPATAALRAYSCIFPGAEYDESAKVDAVTQWCNVKSVRMLVKPQGSVALAMQFLHRWQSPLVAPGAVIETVAARVAAEDGAEVLLDGQTGDELFGFSRYLVSDRLRAGRLLAAMRLAYRWPTGRPTTRAEMLRILAFIGLRGAMPNGMERRVHRRGYRPDLPYLPWLTTTSQVAACELADPWEWKRERPGPLWWRALADTLFYAPNRELRLSYLRHRAAFEGIDADPPLCDPDLIDLTLQIPPEFAFDSRYTRPMIRDAMRGWLPDEVRLQVKKANFLPFVFKTMSGDDAAGLEELLLSPRSEIRRYANIDWIKAEWARLRRGEPESNSPVLWRLAMAEAWLRTQERPEFPLEMGARPDVLDISFQRT